MFAVAARTSKVWIVPLVSPVTVYVVVLTLLPGTLVQVVNEPVPALYRYWYRLMGRPPFEAGAVQSSWTLPLPAVAAKFCGAVGDGSGNRGDLV